MAKILCIDDEPDNRALLSRLLAREGHRVLQSAQVRGGIETALKEHGISVILLDLNIPGVTGLDALKLLKADAFLHSTPVIVITNSEPEPLEAKVRALGAADFVGAPVTDVRIAAAVNRVLHAKPGEA